MTLSIFSITTIDSVNRTRGGGLARPFKPRGTARAGDLTPQSIQVSSGCRQQESVGFVCHPLGGGSSQSASSRRAFSGTASNPSLSVVRSAMTSTGSILRLLTLRRHRGGNAWRAGIRNQQYSRFVTCFSPMHIVDRFSNDLPPVND
jgi:hypothetical protein